METENFLLDLNYSEVDTIFVLRGDAATSGDKFIPEKNGNQFASELVTQIKDLKDGKYVEDISNGEKIDFEIGVAGYPEKHFEAETLDQDIENLKKKVEAGADYIITQMFFDFEKYTEFLELAKKAGITVPIIPGILPNISRKELEILPKIFHVSVPDGLKKMILDSRTKQEEFRNGSKYMINLAQKLIEFGAPGVHIFTLDRAKSTSALLKSVFTK